MSRIEGRFRALASSGRKALVPYVVAGDPSPDLTVELMHTLVKSGADILELGVPFSDPMSEGPVIQLGHERALAHGVSLRDAMEMVRSFRVDDRDTPVLLMGYANPVERMGYDAFANEASAAGVDALLTVDIPPEEVDRLNHELRRVGMDNIFLIAPTTPTDRIEKIAEQASGFLYYVSLKGVTGAGHLDTEEVARRLAMIREHSDLPLAVGFGIKDADSARALAGVADGVVVGSALVARVADAAAQSGDRAALLDAAASLMADIRGGINAAAS
ncbi:MAG: tryptophan synthase subunit alpha [Pseudomonadota bacterium]